MPKPDSPMDPYLQQLKVLTHLWPRHDSFSRLSQLNGRQPACSQQRDLLRYALAGIRGIPSGKPDFVYGPVMGPKNEKSKWMHGNNYAEETSPIHGLPTQ